MLEMGPKAEANLALMNENIKEAYELGILPQ
jgi:hypothetical protein